MGALMLRAERCLNCGGPMRFGLRIDARYCKPSCRTLAYRIRKRTSGPAAKPNQVTPKWADGKPPVLGSALASLAELQARILTVAHQLRQEDLDFRHPPVATEADPQTASREAPHGPRENSAPEDLAARPGWQALVASLGQAETALAAAREQVAKFARHVNSPGGPAEPLRALGTPSQQHAAGAGAAANDPPRANPAETSLLTEAPNKDRRPLPHAERGLPSGVPVQDFQLAENAQDGALIRVSPSHSQPVAQVEDLMRADVPTNSTHRGIPAEKSPRSALLTKDPKPSDHVGKLLQSAAQAKDRQPEDLVEKLLRAKAQAADSRRGKHIEQWEHAETASKKAPLAQPFQRRPSTAFPETKPKLVEPPALRRLLASAAPMLPRPPIPATRLAATQPLVANSQPDAARAPMASPTESPAHLVAAKIALPPRDPATPLTSLPRGCAANAIAGEHKRKQQGVPQAAFLDPRTHVQPQETWDAAGSDRSERPGVEPTQPDTSWNLQPKEKRKKTRDYVSRLLKEHQEDSDEPKTRDHLGPLLQRYIDGEQ